MCDRTVKVRWVIPLATVSIRFLKPLLLFQRFTVRSRIVCVDEKSAYFERKFMCGDEVVAIGWVGLAFFSKSKRISPREILIGLGYPNALQKSPEFAVSLGKLEADLRSSTISESRSE